MDDLVLVYLRRWDKLTWRGNRQRRQDRGVRPGLLRWHRVSWHLWSWRPLVRAVEEDAARRLPLPFLELDLGSRGDCTVQVLGLWLRIWARSRARNSTRIPGALTRSGWHGCLSPS